MQHAGTGPSIDTLRDHPSAAVLLTPGRQALCPGMNYTYGMKVGSISILDLRSERTPSQIISDAAWEKIYDWLDNQTHLLMMASVPEVYLDLPRREKLWRWYPASKIWKTTIFAITG